MSAKKIAVIKGERAETLRQELERILKNSGLDEYLVTAADYNACDGYSYKILGLSGGGAKFDKDEEYNTVVRPYNVEKPPIKSDLLISYDTDNDSADITAKNVRYINDRIVFELLGTGIIGRITLRYGNDNAVKDALLLAAVMLNADIPLRKVTDSFAVFGKAERVI